MASRDDRNGRIDPSFGKEEKRTDEDDFRVDEEERMARSQQRKRTPSRDREPRAARRGKAKPRGFFGFLRRHLDDVAALILAEPDRMWRQLAFIGVKLDADSGRFAR